MFPFLQQRLCLLEQQLPSISISMLDTGLQYIVPLSAAARARSSVPQTVTECTLPGLAIVAFRSSSRGRASGLVDISGYMWSALS